MARSCCKNTRDKGSSEKRMTGIRNNDIRNYVKDQGVNEAIA